LVGALAGLLAACGLVGPPIPPEDVGVAPIIERQKKRDALEATQREAAAAAQATTDPVLQGQDENLPPLRPVGTR
jgi:predicted small lipoprotein YifL